jgi:hypothetical protein
MDVKGFEHLGVAWSWPEFEEPSGRVKKLAHAWAAPGMTLCGMRWPHQIEPFLGRAGKAHLAPKADRIAEIRDAEDRTGYLCGSCLIATPRAR